MHDHTTPPPNNFNSTDDRRTEVGNATRHQYRTLSEEEKQCMNAIKDLGQAFINSCDELATTKAMTSGREFAIAITKMEEAVMWAVKGITK